jgi:DNA-3-methyladenine glycosylase II
LNFTMLPDYWTKASQGLAEADPLMAELVERYAGTTLSSRGDPFMTLARSIVGQQISVKAADAVWGRFVAQVGELTPERLLQLGATGLAGCGLSQRKMEYLGDLAAHFADGRLDPADWVMQDDESLIVELCKVRGIGRWTAEMFLIFNLMRPDVFPLDDIGLQRAVFARYFAGQKQSRQALAAFGERWRPWRSVATWYLWRSLDPVPVAY